ncbi:MAG: hypothetical protein KDB40_22520 [Acidimicrobiales bacterium]|nr:hypothetical protein [Acidimicrobiales bacterium]
MASSSRTERLRLRSRVEWWLVAVGLVVAAIALVGLPGRATFGARLSGDEPQYLLTAISLGDDLDLDVSDEIAERRYLPYHEVALDQQTMPLDASGRQVSPHDPLLPALLAPAMRLGGWAAAKAVLALIAGMTAALTAAVAHRRFHVPRRTAAVVTIAGFAGLPLAGYGTQVYPEMTAALATMVVVAGVTQQRRLASGPVDVPRGAWLVMVVAAIVALPWLSVKYVPVAAVCGVAVLARLRHSPRRLVAVVGSLVASGVVYLALHRWWYGGWTVYAAGDHFADTGEFGVVGTEVDLLGRSRRIVGLLVDRDFGIAAWSPIWFVLPLALAAAWARRREPGTALLVAIVAAAWLNATFVALTMHGWWMPGRQLVIGLPVGVVSTARWVGAARGRLVTVAVLGSVGLCNWLWLAIEASTGRRTLIVDFFDTASWPYRALRPVLPAGLGGGGGGDALLVGWAVLIAASVVVATHLSRGSVATDLVVYPAGYDVGREDVPTNAP